MVPKSITLVEVADEDPGILDLVVGPVRYASHGWLSRDFRAKQAVNYLFIFKDIQVIDKNMFRFIKITMTL